MAKLPMLKREKCVQHQRYCLPERPWGPILSGPAVMENNMKTSGTNLEHARAHNRRVVIEAIRLHGELTVPNWPA